jgi:hypothetical protein
MLTQAKSGAALKLCPGVSPVHNNHPLKPGQSVLAPSRILPPQVSDACCMI